MTGKHAFLFFVLQNAHLWKNMFQPLNDYSMLVSFRLQHQLH